jgi:spermidine/putrescine transport system ATP-binding protein
MKYIVEVKKITKKYGKVTAVKDVSFRIKQGEFFSLLGPSGCGKTTILRIIGGFIDTNEGVVIIDGVDMKNTPPNKRDTSMVFQNLALFPHMNVSDNITYGVKKRKLGKDKTLKKLSDILRIVNLTGYEKRRIDQLSGGQQQRVALARSLILEPKILLLDEPLASLDKKLRVSMRMELKEIQRRTGTTFLYVTHDQSEALTMSDTVAVMNNGEIIQSGAPDFIYNNPANIFVADFIGAGNFIPVDKVDDCEDNLRITTKNGGLIIAKKHKSISTGDFNKKVFFIRPEKVKISKYKKHDIAGTTGSMNHFSGEIISKIFEGPDIRLMIYSEKIGNITAELKNDKHYNNLLEDNMISFYWNQSEGMILEMS